MLAVLEQHEVRARVVCVPKDDCCWLWAAGVCGGEIAVDAFVRTPWPRARLTPTALRLVRWMLARRVEVSRWLERGDGAAALEQVPDDTITDLYGCVDIDGCAQRSAVPAQILLETEWGRSLHLHGLAQVACVTQTSGGYLTLAPLAPLAPLALLPRHPSPVLTSLSLSLYQSVPFAWQLLHKDIVSINCAAPGDKATYYRCCAGGEAQPGRDETLSWTEVVAPRLAAQAAGFGVERALLVFLWNGSNHSTRLCWSRACRRRSATRWRARCGSQ